MRQFLKRADSGQAAQARFNFPGQTQGLFCAQHAQDGMRNVMHKPCAAEGCPLQAVFNKEGESRGIYCSRHKEEGMARPGAVAPCWCPSGAVACPVVLALDVGGSLPHESRGVVPCQRACTCSLFLQFPRLLPLCGQQPACWLSFGQVDLDT